MCRLIVDLMDFQGSTHMMDLFLFSTIVCNSGCYTVFYFSVSLPPFFLQKNMDFIHVFVFFTERAD